METNVERGKMSNECPHCWQTFGLLTTARWFISLHQRVDPVVCRVHVEQAVVAGRIPPDRARNSCVDSGHHVGNSAGPGLGKYGDACCRERYRCPKGQRAQVLEPHVHEGEAHIHFYGFGTCAATTSFVFSAGSGAVFPRNQIIDCG